MRFELSGDEVRCMILVKNDERYVWLFDREHIGEMLRSLGRMASDKELSFSWYDAVVIANRIRGEKV